MKYLLSLALVALAGALRFQQPSLPHGWTEVAAAAASRISVQVVLHNENTDTLRQIALDVSNPRSPKYGQYLSSDEIAELTRPSPARMAAVQTWLTMHSLSYEVGRMGDILVVTGTVANFEQAFGTKYTVAVKDNKHIHRAGDVNIPETIGQHIKAVVGVHGLPLPKATRLDSAPVPVAYNVTPSVIESRYKVSGVTASGTDKNRQAVAEFQHEYFNPADLVQFFKSYVPNAKTGDDKVYKYINNDPDSSGDEAALDIEYIMGVAPGLLSEFWEFPAMQFCSDLVNWTQAILKDDNAPLVHSVSYGYQGNLTDLGCHAGDVDTVDQEFQKLAAKGISIIFASGDSGSGYDPDQGCSGLQNEVKYKGKVVGTVKTNDFMQCCSACKNNTDCAFWSCGFNNENYCTLFNSGAVPQGHQTGWISGTAPGPSRLWPSWPASSEWVTAVGSTRFVDNNPSSGAEMATDQFGSGGGFSFMFDQPSWQKDAVASFLQNEPSSKLPPADMWAKNGRATPDVAALGEGFQVVLNGGVEPIGGTSASTPTFAGLISLINEKRIASGKKGLGFLNQFIYQNPSDYMDVTVGDNRRGRGPFTLPYGYDCVKGWDPATGFGTPNFEAILKSAMALP